MSGPLLSPDKLADLWMHHNSLVWSRLKTAAALEAGIIAGWYYSMTDDLPEVAAPLAILGAILIVLIAAIVISDLASRNKVREALQTQAAPLPFASGGRWMLGAIMAALFACNMALSWCSLKYPHSMAAPLEEDSDQTVSHRVVTS